MDAVPEGHSLLRVKVTTKDGSSTISQRTLIGESVAAASKVKSRFSTWIVGTNESIHLEGDMRDQYDRFFSSLSASNINYSIDEAAGIFKDNVFTAKNKPGLYEVWMESNGKMGKTQIEVVRPIPIVDGIIKNSLVMAEVEKESDILPRLKGIPGIPATLLPQKRRYSSRWPR